MKKFRFAAFLVLLGIGILLSACQKQEWRPGMPLDKDKVKIGVIHPNLISENSGYDYTHFMGTQAMRQNLGLKEEQIIRRNNVNERENAGEAIRGCIRQGANIILATSWDYMDVCEALAAEYPGVIFVHATGYKHNKTNFTNYAGRMYQARYLSGIAAGLKTGTGKIGYVAAMGKENNETTSGINAFALGVEQVNPGARIYVRVTYSWYDPVGETIAAERLIARGCDVIAQHCDSASAQIAAQEAGVWGIGAYTDMSMDAPDTVLTSVIVRWGVYYTRLVQSIIDGSFTTKPYFGSLADGMVDIVPLTGRLATPGMAERIAFERKRIVSGSFNVFEGILETNDGRYIGEEGKSLPDEEISGRHDWYYRTVIEE